MKGFKTVAYGVSIALTAVLSSPDMQSFIAAHIPSIGAGIGAGVVILRAITSSAVFKA